MSYNNLAVDTFEVTNRYAEALAWSANDVLAAATGPRETASRLGFVRGAVVWAAQVPGGLSRRLRAPGAGISASKLTG
jgi:hypothetical protein